MPLCYQRMALADLQTSELRSCYRGVVIGPPPLCPRHNSRRRCRRIWLFYHRCALLFCPPLSYLGGELVTSRGRQQGLPIVEL